MLNRKTSWNDYRPRANRRRYTVRNRGTTVGEPISTRLPPPTSPRGRAGTRWSVSGRSPVTPEAASSTAIAPGRLKAANRAGKRASEPDAVRSSTPVVAELRRSRTFRVRVVTTSSLTPVFSSPVLSSQSVGFDVGVVSDHLLVHLNIRSRTILTSPSEPQARGKRQQSLSHGDWAGPAAHRRSTGGVAAARRPAKSGLHRAVSTGTSSPVAVRWATTDRLDPGDRPRVTPRYPE